MSRAKSYKTKADFDDAVAAFKAEHRSMKKRCLDVDKERKRLTDKYQAQVDKEAEHYKKEIGKLNKWVKELKKEIRDLKTKPGTCLYLAKSATEVGEVYIAADSFAAAEQFFTDRHSKGELESLSKLSDSFLAEI